MARMRCSAVRVEQVERGIPDRRSHHEPRRAIIADATSARRSSRQGPGFAVRPPPDFMLLAQYLDNACKYSDVGLAVTMRRGAIGGGNGVLGAQLGPVIPMADRERIFDRYYRSTASATALPEPASVSPSPSALLSPTAVRCGWRATRPREPRFSRRFPP